MIIDTHCHYNLEPLLADWQSHWKDAQEHTVVSSLVVGTSIPTSATALELATSVPEWRAAAGIHPSSSFHQGDEQKLEQLLPSKQVVAIGECGLDYFRLADNPYRKTEIEQQQLLLITQMQLAKKYQLPLIIHLRDTGEEAYWDFLALYKQHAAPGLPFILHCVSGPLDFVRQAVELGAHIGVAGNVTYKNADHIRELVNAVPTNRVLLETDAPYLPPTPHRGHICQPWMIQLTQRFLTTELSISEETLFTTTAKLFPQFVQNN